MSEYSPEALAARALNETTRQRFGLARKLATENAPCQEPAVVSYVAVAETHIWEQQEETRTAEMAARPVLDAFLQQLTARGLGLYAIEERARYHDGDGECPRQGVGECNVWKVSSNIVLVTSAANAYDALNNSIIKLGDRVACDTIEYRIAWYVGPNSLTV